MNKAMSALSVIAMAGLFSGVAVQPASADLGIAVKGAGCPYCVTQDKEGCAGKDGCEGKDDCSGKDGCEGKDDCSGKEACGGKDGCGGK